MSARKEPSRIGDNWRALQDAELVLVQLQRAEIELRFATADLSLLRVLADYPELGTVLRELGAAMMKLRRSVDYDGQIGQKAD